MITLAIINTTTNTCENISVDDRPIEEIVLPDPYIVKDLYTTPAINWIWNETTNQWDSVECVGGIGYAWDGTKLIAPLPPTP